MFEDKTFIVKAGSLRPFYFIVVVWGERYIDFLLNFCISSLLSPNNIPALLNSGNKFLIATTDEDWGRMQLRPMFQLLKQYVETVFLRIPPCPSAELRCIHMGIGHKLATHMAFEDRAYAAVLTPDLMVSDGTVAALQRHAVNGIQVVLTAALRFGEEPLFERLKQMEIAASNPPSGDEATPLVVTGRQLVSAGIRSFHSETLSYEWEAPYFVDVPSAVWWRVPGEDGVIVHSLSWAPLLIDYDAVEHHDSSVMDNWTIDGDYIHRNFGLNGKVHVVQDSDELMLVSWAPLADRPSPLTPRPEYTRRFLGELKKGIIFNRVLSSPFFDPLKRQILYKPVYWHSETINLRDKGPWLFTEARAQRVLRMYGTGGLNLNMYGAAGGLMLKLTHLRNALRIFRDAVGTKYVLHDADGINHSWVNISLTQKIPAYNHAINLWIQATGNSWAKEDICGFVLKHMAEFDPAIWGKDYHLMMRMLGYALRPSIVMAKYIRTNFFLFDHSWRLQKHILYIIKVITRRIGLLLIGNRVALRWWWWRLRKLWSDFVRRRPFLEQRPPAP